MQSCQTFTSPQPAQDVPLSPSSLVALFHRWWWKPTWTWIKTQKRRSSSISPWRSTSPQSSSSGTPTKTYGYWWPAVWLTSSGSTLPRRPTPPTTNSRLGTTKHSTQKNNIQKQSKLLSWKKQAVGMCLVVYTIILFVTRHHRSVCSQKEISASFSNCLKEAEVTKKRQTFCLITFLSRVPQSGSYAWVLGYSLCNM